MADDQLRLSKAQRHHRIQQILERHTVLNQAQLVERLAEDGVAVNQATVSRDLDELGAIKIRVPGGESAYAVPELPQDRHSNVDHLRRVLADWVVEIAVAAPIVVLRTPPGCAHVVASAIDRAGLPEILGTVAGDDTMLLVSAPVPGAEELAQRIGDMAGASVLDAEHRDKEN